MKKTIILLSSIILGFSSTAFALTSNDLSQLSANAVGGDELYMQVLINIPSGESADIYFSYGTSENSLSHHTDHVSKEGGFHVISEFVKGLQSGTTYYYRAHANDIQTGIRSATTLNQTHSLPGIEESSGGTVTTDQNQFLNNPLSFFGNNAEEQGGGAEEANVPEGGATSDSGSTSVSNSNETSSDSTESVQPYTEEPISEEVHSDAVYFNDTEGEVLEYSEEYKNRFKPKKEQGNNWLWILLLLLLGVIGFLVYKMRGKKKISDPRFNRHQRLHQYRRRAQTGYVDSRDYFKSPEVNPSAQPDRFRSPGEAQSVSQSTQQASGFVDNRNEASFVQNTGVTQPLPGAEPHIATKPTSNSDRTVFRPRPRK